ncbi:TonB-dependent receptor plug domain-containing protein, partial [uncultured Sphingobium sp.]|uniref:TonB-dependent receptor plug domain-containing protein n=1 Tax=uncultured Sphingobium sp. TaxID=316087 RepID=UPI00261BD6B4
MSNNLQTLLVISTALATLGSVDGALAQQAPDRLDANSDSTIIVTAQKRQQTLIDVAQSVSVLSADTLENQSVNTIADFLNAVPSLQLVQSTPGQGRIILRGVNTGGVASTVAVYIDETPFGSSSGLANGAELAGDFDTFDLSRIEVLRGPQGTLYGRNTIGGAVKYVTRMLPQEFSLKVKGTYGS